MAHHYSSGLPPGATLLPGRQIPPGAERPDGVAARWDPVGPAMHAALLRTLRKTTTNHQGRGETPAWFRRSETGRSCWVLTWCSLSQLLQAFYQQQEEIRGLREQLQHKDVSNWDVLTLLLMCLGCNWWNQTAIVSVVSGHNHSAGAGDQKHQEQFEGHLLIGPISFNAGPTTNEMLLV